VRALCRGGRGRTLGKSLPEEAGHEGPHRMQAAAQKVPVVRGRQLGSACLPGGRVLPCRDDTMNLIGAGDRGSNETDYLKKGGRALPALRPQHHAGCHQRAKVKVSREMAMNPGGSPCRWFTGVRQGAGRFTVFLTGRGGLLGERTRKPAGRKGKGPASGPDDVSAQRKSRGNWQLSSC